MAEDCEVCRMVCTISTGDPFNDECHDLLDEFAQADDASPQELCDVLEDEFGVSCDELPFTIPAD